MVVLSRGRRVRIRFNPAALEAVKWHEYLTRFLLGGAVTLATGLIGHHFGPVVGGLFLAFPAIFPASATLLEKHERGKKRRAGIDHTIRGRLAAALDARGAAMGTLALTAFALFVWKLLPGHNAAVVLSAALALWLMLAVLLWRLRKLHVYGAVARRRAGLRAKPRGR
jgi:hypothetical protein